MQNNYPNLFESNPSSFQQILHEKFFALKAYTRFYLSNLRGKQKILIYSMGKVGSSTIINSLYKSGLNRNFSIYRVHFLTGEGINHLRIVNNKSFETLHEFNHETKSQILLSRFLRKQILEREIINKQYKIITLIREPIALNISDYFQNYNQFIPKAKLNQSQKRYTKELVCHFFDKYPHELPLMWFDTEFQKVFRGDIFLTPFPKKKGYKIYKNQSIEVLIIKLEQLDECGDQAFKEFLGVSHFNILNANEANQKAYKKLYNNFLKEISIPQSYIERMYHSKYTQYFYSDNEIKLLKDKWLNTSKQ